MGPESLYAKNGSPRNWVSLVPYGLNQQHPNAYKDIVEAFWENKDQLSYAWRILNDGSCHGCALGTSGMHDWMLVGAGARCGWISVFSKLPYNRLSNAAQVISSWQVEPRGAARSRVGGAGRCGRCGTDEITPRNQNYGANHLLNCSTADHRPACGKALRSDQKGSKEKMACC
jgi:hypothetical protein